MCLSKFRPVNKRRAIACARLFTHLTKARRAIHCMPKIYNLSLLVLQVVTSYFLKTGHRASFLLEFAKKQVATDSILKKISCCTLGNQGLFFSCPSKVEVVKNKLYHVKKNPFKCIKNNYFCLKQSRQFVSFAVKTQTKATST